MRGSTEEENRYPAYPITSELKLVLLSRQMKCYISVILLQQQKQIQRDSPTQQLWTPKFDQVNRHCGPKYASQQNNQTIEASLMRRQKIRGNRQLDSVNSHITIITLQSHHIMPQSQCTSIPASYTYIHHTSISTRL